MVIYGDNIVDSLMKVKGKIMSESISLVKNSILIV